jgi:hypothetical protein
MADASTTRYALIKPEVGAASNTWGGSLNSNFDTLDSNIWTISGVANSAQTIASAAMPKSGGTFTGNITLFADPSSPLHPVSLQYLTGNYLPLTGGVLTSFLSLHAKPTSNLHAATKNYVDDAFLPLTGGQLSGALTLSGNPTQANHATPRDWVLQQISSGGGNYVPLSGNSQVPMSGPLILYGTAPAAANEAVPKSYVDGIVGTSGTLTATVNTHTNSINSLNTNAILKSGGTINSGSFLTLGTAPTSDLHAATKAYADTKLARDGSQPITGNLTIQNSANQMAIFLGSSGGYFYGDATFAGWTRAGGASVRWEAANGNFSTNGSITGTALNLSGGNISSVGTITVSSTINGGSLNLSSGSITCGTITSSSSITGTSLNVSNGSLTCGAISSSSISCATSSHTTQIVTSQINGGSTSNGGSLNIFCSTLTASSDITLTSDERLKEDIRTIDNAVEISKQLRGVSYVRKDTGKLGIGVVAQEVEKVLPQLVVTDANGMKSVAYANMVGILIEAVKELSARVEELEAR